eukprot:1349183-Rhodomonas_salina.1
MLSTARAVTSQPSSGAAAAPFTRAVTCGGERQTPAGGSSGGGSAVAAAASACMDGGAEALTVADLVAPATQAWQAPATFATCPAASVYRDNLLIRYE